MYFMLDLSSRDRCFVIAEAGTCHASPEPGNTFNNAMGYVMAAKDMGADCIKFQMFDDSDLFCPYPGDEQRMPRWRDSGLNISAWRQIKEFTEACGMMFLASVFQNSMVDMLRKLKVEATKVASRAAEKFPYGDAPEPYLISTGMIGVLSLPSRVKSTQHHLLQCEANYPSTARWSMPEISEDEVVKLIPGGIVFMDVPNVEGFSDHSGTPWRAIDAISRGCKLVEVHFYIDEIDAGPDLPASLNLDELKLVCEARDAFAELRRAE